MNLVSTHDPSTDTDMDATRADPTGPSSPSSQEGRLGRGEQVGRYIILDVIGVGGMGEVFSAYDPELDRRLALKLVKFSTRDDGGVARSRLLREAQAMAKLAHPNVVAVHDAGTHLDQVFIAMEYVEGQTLRQWLEETSPAWVEALGTMVRAGRGLAAAHAVGLVHRDFKPANVMVGANGRVRVLDFGLARQSDDEENVEGRGPVPRVGSPPSGPNLSSDSRGGSFAASLTQTGTVMGTPAYMAPEQFICDPIDARTDQFSFCVVAFRAMFGIAPFAGGDYDELVRAVTEGQIREIPTAVRVPRVVRTALLRGLSPRPEERYPSMDALLADLKRGAGHGRRRLRWGAAGLAIIAGGVMVITLPDSERSVVPCLGAEAKLEGIWDEARREAVAASFSSSALPFAEDARAETTRALDMYTLEWVRLRTEVCEATRVQGDQSEALMDLRIQCLEERLRDVVALTGVFVDADAKVVENAAAAVHQLPPLQGCTTVERADSGLLDPADPELAVRVAEVRQSIAQARALLQAGKFEESLNVGSNALERAQELGFEPAIAEAALIIGQSHERLVHPKETLDAYERALNAATASGYTDVAARSLIGLASILGTHLDDVGASLRYSRQARAKLHHMGDPPDLVGALALFTGNTHFRAQDYDAAIAELRRAIELTADQSIAGRTHLAALNNLAAVQGHQGHYREAIESLEQGLQIAESWLGPVHPLVANHHNNLGATYARLERLDEAMTHLTKALKINTAVLGEEHPDVGRAHHNLGVILAGRGDLEGALVRYRTARDIKIASLGPNDPSVAFSTNNVGDALLQLGRVDEAVTSFDEALRIWTTSQGAEHPDNLYALMSLGEAWLEQGGSQDTVALMRRALRILEASEVDPATAANTRFIAARVLWRAGEPRAQARALAERAREDYSTSERPSAKEISTIDAWLSNPT